EVLLRLTGTDSDAGKRRLECDHPYREACSHGHRDIAGDRNATGVVAVENQVTVEKSGGRDRCTATGVAAHRTGILSADADGAAGTGGPIDAGAGHRLAAVYLQWSGGGIGVVFDAICR